MSRNTNQMVVSGNLTDEPTLNFTKSGTAVAHLTIAHNSQRYDGDKGEWIDNDAVFVRCNVWGKQAENVAESLHKGSHVIAAGEMSQNSYTDNEGVKRTTLELEVQDIGPSLKFTAATVNAAALAAAASV